MAGRDNYKSSHSEEGDDIVNDSLTLDMGSNFARHTVTLSALGTWYDMAYGEWCSNNDSAETYPVVICIHGAPATEGAYRKIGSLIASKGYRVIAVNFPGMGYTHTDSEHRYNHSTPHKAELVKRLIYKLQLESIAMVIGHSLGGHVAGHIAADPELEGIVQSVCFLCGPGSRPHRLYRRATMVPYLPYFIYKTMYLPVVGWFVTYFFSTLVYRVGLRGRTPEAQVLSIYEAYQLDFSRFAKDIRKIAQQRLPVLLIYAEDDTIVEAAIPEDNMVVLGIAKKDVVHYDKDGKTEETFQDDKLHRAVCFVSGSHRLQFKRPQQVVAETVSFLDALVKHQKSNKTQGGRVE